MNNRQLAALETKRKLMEAAQKLICEKGLNDTSVEQITETAGVSKGTFYTYFKKKEDIVLALSRGMFGENSGTGKVIGRHILRKTGILHGEIFRLYRAGKCADGTGMGEKRGKSQSGDGFL